MANRIKVYEGPSLEEAEQAYQNVLAQYVDELKGYTLQGKYSAQRVEQLKALRYHTVQAANTLVTAWEESNPIRVARKARGLSAQALAKSVGLSHPTIQSWENGSVYNPTDTGMEALADFLGDALLFTKWYAWYDKNPGIQEVRLHVPPIPNFPEA